MSQLASSSCLINSTMCFGTSGRDFLDSQVYLSKYSHSVLPKRKASFSFFSSFSLSNPLLDLGYHCLLFSTPQTCQIALCPGTIGPGQDKRWHLKSWIKMLSAPVDTGDEGTLGAPEPCGVSLRHYLKLACSCSFALPLHIKHSDVCFFCAALYYSFSKKDVFSWGIQLSSNGSGHRGYFF